MSATAKWAVAALVAAAGVVLFFALRPGAPALTPGPLLAEPGRSTVNALGFLPDGTLLAAVVARPEPGEALPRGALRFYRLPDGVPARPALETGDVRSLAVSRDGALVALGFYYDLPRVIRLDGGGDVALGDKPLLASTITLSPDGKRVAFDGRGVEVRGTVDGALFRTFEGRSLPAFSPDGALLAVQRDDLTFELWRTADWTLAGTLDVTAEDTRGPAAFSPDGRRFAWLSGWKHLRLWRVSDRTLTADRFVGKNRDDYGPGALAWASDSRTVYARGRGTAIEAFDGEDGAPLSVVSEDAATQPPPLGPDTAKFAGVQVLAASSRWLAAGEAQGAVATWDLLFSVR